MGDEERVDGKMLYHKEDDETVKSEMTNRVMGCKHIKIPRADQSSFVEPPLPQPSQIIYSRIGLKQTPRETQGDPKKTSGADHLIPMEPSLAQPSQIEDFGISNFRTEGESYDKKGCIEHFTINPGQNEATEDTSTQEKN